MDNFLATGALWFSIGGVIALILITLLIAKNRIIGLLLKNPSYAEKHKHKYFSIDSNEIILLSKIPPGGNEGAVGK